MLKPGEIQSLIRDDAISQRKRNAKKGQDYYNGEHEILQYRLYYFNADGVLVEDKTRSNIKISHPFLLSWLTRLCNICCRAKSLL